MPTLALPQAGLLMMRFTASFCHIGSCVCMGTASYYHLLEQGGSRRCARRQMPKRPSSPPPRNLGYSPLQRDPNSMEDCLPSPSMVPGLCPPPCPSGQSARLQSTPRARSRLVLTVQCRPQRSRPWRAIPRGGVRDRGGRI